MTTIRIGNDVHVRWSVFSRNGAPYILDGATIRLWLLSGPFRKRITDFSISENVVYFLVDAKDIHRYGIYKLVLSLTDSASQTEDTAFDFTEVFQIVSKTYSGSTDAVLDGDVVVTPSSIIDNVVENYVTNAADGEDLTTVNNLLKFRDRPAGDGAKGYVILRQNKTIAEQVTEEDTTYEIRYEFDLDGESVTIPSGCVLKFNGGSIVNGTIVGQNTKIDAEPVTIFDNINFSGNWNVPAYYVEWFGVIGDGETDDTAAFQNALALGLGYYLATGNYKITGTLLVRNANTLDGNNQGKIIFDASAAEHPESLVCIELAVERAYMWQHTRVQNITLQGSKYNENNYNTHHEDEEETYQGYGIYCNKRSEVNNCFVVGFNYGLVAASYEVYCHRSSIMRNFVNVGIASADLFPPDGNWPKQTNAVTIAQTILKTPRSGDSVTIGMVTGRNPWASESSANPAGNGHLNIIDDCTIDGGRIVVENIAQTTIRHCYFEWSYGSSSADPNAVYTGIEIRNKVWKIKIEDNFFHLLHYGILGSQDADSVMDVSINNNYFGTIGYTGVYFYKTPSSTISFKSNLGGLSDYRLAHFGFDGMGTSAVNDRLKLLRAGVQNSTFPASPDVILKDELFATIKSASVNPRLSTAVDNYMTRQFQLSFSGAYTEEGVFAFSSTTPGFLKSVIPGYKISGHDCFIAYVDIKNKTAHLYSPTDDYPNTSETTLYYQTPSAAIGVTVANISSYNNWEGRDVATGEFLINQDPLIKKLEVKTNDNIRCAIPTLNKEVARCVGFKEDLSIDAPSTGGANVFVMDTSLNLGGSTIDVTPNAIIYYAGGRIYGTGTINFSNNIIIGVEKISDLIINPNITITGSYYINNKPASGATSARPSNAPAGYVYFDASLGTYGKPIWSDGDGHWVDATGTSV